MVHHLLRPPHARTHCTLCGCWAGLSRPHTKNKMSWMNKNDGDGGLTAGMLLTSTINSKYQRIQKTYQVLDRPPSSSIQRQPPSFTQREKSSMSGAFSFILRCWLFLWSDRGVQRTGRQRMGMTSMEWNDVFRPGPCVWVCVSEAYPPECSHQHTGCSKFIWQVTITIGGISPRTWSHSHQPRSASAAAANEKCVSAPIAVCNGQQ